MENSNYVAVSALLALEKRVATIAHNVANVSTTGFRAEEVKFEAVISHTGNKDIAYASTGATFLTRQSGPILPTGNPLDVAVKGNAWMALNSPSGRVYTRDGRLEMAPDGALRTGTGHAVLDVGGSPLRLDPNAGPPTIAPDGMISQGNTQVGAIGLFRMPENAHLRRIENSAVSSDQEAAPVLSFNDTGILQGHLEGSNVNPVQELSRLISVSRTFQAVMSTIETNHSAHKTAIRALGSSS
jgi:flagellar basal-body rod protein FlgF